MSESRCGDRVLNEMAFYLALRSPRFAIMITGAWGSGKSYQAMRVAKLFPERDLRYVSLFGVATVDQFRQRLLRPKVSAAVSLLASACGSAWNRVMGWMLQAAGRIAPLKWLAIDVKAKKCAEKWLLRVLARQCKAMILDDVERCDMHPQELLGLINDVLERQLGCVIMVCDIDRLFASDPTSKVILEKIVGRIVRVEPDVDGAVKAFVEELPGSSSDLPWVGYKDQMVASCAKVANMSGYGNMRLLRHAIIGFYRYTISLPGDILENGILMLEFLEAMLCKSIEWHKRDLEDANCDDVWLVGSSLAAMLLDSRPDSKKLCKKYEGVLGVFLDIGPQDWKHMICDGASGLPSVDAALRRRADQLRGTEPPSYMRLMNFASLNGEEFESCVKDVIELLRAGKLPSVSVIRDTCLLLHFLRQRGAFESEIDFLGEARTRVRDELQRLDIASAIERGDIVDISGAPRVNGRHRFEADYAQELDEDIGEAILAKMADFCRVRASQLEGLLAKDPRAFMDAAAGNSKLDASLVGYPVLSNIDPLIFAEAVSRMTVEECGFVTRGLARRFSNPYHRGNDSEWQWLLRLEERLCEVHESAAVGIKSMSIRECREAVREIAIRRPTL